MPVEEDMDGWEVKVYILLDHHYHYRSMSIPILILILIHKVEFNKNFSKINFFNGLTQVSVLNILHIFLQQNLQQS